MKISELIQKLKDINEQEGDLDVKYAGEDGSEETLCFVDVEKVSNVLGKDGTESKYILLN